MNYAGAMLIAGGASSLFSYLDTLLIGAFLSTAAVGIYSAPLRLTALVGYPALALAQGVAPRMARHPDEPPKVAALERAIGYIVILQAAVVALPALVGRPHRASGPRIGVLGVRGGDQGPDPVHPADQRHLPADLLAQLRGRGKAADPDRVRGPDRERGDRRGPDPADRGPRRRHRNGRRLCRLRRRPPVAVSPTARPPAEAARGDRRPSGARRFGVWLRSSHWSAPTASPALQWVVGLAFARAAFLATLLATRALSLDEIRTLVRLPVKALRSG